MELELFQSIFCFFNSCRLKMIGKICEGERIVLVDAIQGAGSRHPGDYRHQKDLGD